MIILKNMYMYDAAMLLLVAVGCRVGGKGFRFGGIFCVYHTCTGSVNILLSHYDPGHN